MPFLHIPKVVLGAPERINREKVCPEQPPPQAPTLLSALARPAPALFPVDVRQ
jgi:hypothetical protein